MKRKSPVRRRGIRAGQGTEEASSLPLLRRLTVATVLSSGCLPASLSLSSWASGALRLIERKPKAKLHPVPFFFSLSLSDFYCQDHGREKALLFICLLCIIGYLLCARFQGNNDKQDRHPCH